MENILMELKSEYEQFYGFEDKEEYCKGIKLAIDKLEALSQHSANLLVSGNEANQPENKKDGEVAVAFADWTKRFASQRNISGQILRDGYWLYLLEEEGKQLCTTEELYEKFKSAKATDR